MITTLTATTTDGIVSRLLAEEGLAGGSHVLTLLIDTDRWGLEEALAAAHGASRDHPCRIVAVVRPDEGDEAAAGARSHDGHVAPELPGHLDAEIRVGHDAGAGETLVLLPWGEAAEHTDTLVVPFLLPDVPVVAWWPTEPPECPSRSPLGRLASTRITNTPALAHPVTALEALAPSFTRGDIDLAWTRITLWRAMVASTLDPVLREGSVGGLVIAGEPENAAMALMTQWLALRTGVVVERVDVPGFSGSSSSTVTTPAGEVVIARTDQERVTITRPGGGASQLVTMPRREPITTMNEELRRLTTDLVFEEVLASFAAECRRASGKARS